MSKVNRISRAQATELPTLSMPFWAIIEERT